MIELCQFTRKTLNCTLRNKRLCSMWSYLNKAIREMSPFFGCGSWRENFFSKYWQCTSVNSAPNSTASGLRNWDKERVISLMWLIQKPCLSPNCPLSPNPLETNQGNPVRGKCQTLARAPARLPVSYLQFSQGVLISQLNWVFMKPDEKSAKF